MKPLLMRRTFWIGALAGAVLTTLTLGTYVLWRVPYQGLRSTATPIPKTYVPAPMPSIEMPPCDYRFKDCVDTDVHTVPEPGTIFLVALGAAGAYGWRKA